MISCFHKIKPGDRVAYSLFSEPKIEVELTVRSTRPYSFTPPALLLTFTDASIDVAEDLIEAVSRRNIFDLKILKTKMVPKS